MKGLRRNQHFVRDWALGLASSSRIREKASERREIITGVASCSSAPEFFTYATIISEHFRAHFRLN